MKTHPNYKYNSFSSLYFQHALECVRNYRKQDFLHLQFGYICLYLLAYLHIEKAAPKALAAPERKRHEKIKLRIVFIKKSYRMGSIG